MKESIEMGNLEHGKCSHEDQVKQIMSYHYCPDKAIEGHRNMLFLWTI